MSPPPFDIVFFLFTPNLPPSTSKGRDDRSPPQPIPTLGRAFGMTVSIDGFAWLYIEPADAADAVVRVALIHCRRACSPEVYQHDCIRRRTLAALVEQRRTEFVEQSIP